MKIKITDNPLFLTFMVILIINFALFYGLFSSGHDWGGDFSAYIMQARSIVEYNPLQFIEENRFTIEQSSIPMGPIAYPWGFPILLAPVYAYYGLNLTMLKLVGVVSYSFFLVTLYHGFNKVHSRYWLVLLILLFAFNPAMLGMGDQILSDLVFLFFSTLSVILIWRTVARRKVIIHSIVDQIILGAVIAFSFSVRTNGFLLLPTLALAQLVLFFELRAQQLAVASDKTKNTMSRNALASHGGILYYLVPYVVFVFFVLMERIALPEGGGSYIGLLKNITADSVLEGVKYNLVLPETFFGSRYLYFISIPFVVIGIKNRWRDSFCILTYCTLTMILYSLWPYRQGLRFLYPVLPFYISFFISGLESVSRSKFTMMVKALPAMVFLVPLGFLSASASSAYKNISHGRPVPEGPFTEESMGMFRFIEKNTSSTDIVVFRKPRVLRLMVSRPSIRALTIKDVSPGNLLVIDARNSDKQLNDHDVSYLVVSEKATLVYKNTQFSIYKINNEY